MTIITGDCLEVMKTFPDNHFSGIVTDPPYGLGFMGKKWDAELPHAEIWKEALRITKPGGYIVAFGGTRTYHRLTCAIEDAGWEIRDCLMWIYGSGFPKSHNHFGIEGYGTALKPAYEPIIMAMKPCDGTFKQNAEKWGQAGINIDGCRIESHELKSYSPGLHRGSLNDDGWKGKEQIKEAPKGRWPANVMFDEEAAEMLDEQSGNLKSGHLKQILSHKQNKIYGKFQRANLNEFESTSGGASRFFYCAKASSRERNEGLDELPLKENPEHSFGRYRCKKCNGLKLDHKPCVCIEPDFEKIQVNKNNHPTIKPLKLMQYLIKLVMPQTGGILLDPFAGSGSTILAAKISGFEAIGIEKQSEYADIARKRIEAYERKLNQIPEQLDLLQNISLIV